MPTATYRLQITPQFDLFAAADLCGYLHDLGVGEVYVSPILQAASGSQHGYDVVDFSRIDPARGGAAGWQALVGAAHRHGLTLIVDIVPNHTGVANPAENPAWWDVLRRGPASSFAPWFDIDWSHGKVLLPVLGDDAGTELRNVDGELRYHEQRFPLDQRHYALVNFRRADTEQNYRRFFAVSTLAGLRVEDPEVFEATHREVLRWVAAGEVQGLRVDHPDGLADPLGYLRRLRAAAPEAWLLVEKILERGETLPPSWPVDGTTGYDALAEATGVLIDPSGEAAFDDLYQELTGDHRAFTDHVEAGKRLVATTILHAEVLRLARLAQVDGAEAAFTELLVVFPVYRSYLQDGRAYLDEAFARARARRPDLGAVFDAVAPRLTDPDDELCVRFQQTSGAVMAKGVEDTAYYRYTRFVALNEVGGNPARFGMSLDEFHASQARRSARTMTTLSTHDTKRGEDVRARLAVLAELPDEWGALVRRLMRAVPMPNPAFGYLLWQTFAGAGLIARDRMHAYAEKAMREAADGTGWRDPDAAFERAVHAAVDAGYESTELRAFVEDIAAPGWSNSLTQKLVQLTMPGVPDVYQGSELWDDSLVDPDNRRPVDFAARRALLASLSAPPPVDGSGAAKLWVVARTLDARREHPELFRGYTPLHAAGAAVQHAIAFDRGGAISVATRQPVRLARDGGWRDTTLRLGAPYRDAFTGVAYTGDVPLAELLSALPVALLLSA